MSVVNQARPGGSTSTPRAALPHPATRTRNTPAYHRGTAGTWCPGTAYPDLGRIA